MILATITTITKHRQGQGAKTKARRAATLFRIMLSLLFAQALERLRANSF